MATPYAELGRIAVRWLLGVDHAGLSMIVHDMQLNRNMNMVFGTGRASHGPTSTWVAAALSKHSRIPMLDSIDKSTQFLCNSDQFFAYREFCAQALHATPVCATLSSLCHPYFVGRPWVVQAGKTTLRRGTLKS